MIIIKAPFFMLGFGIALVDDAIGVVYRLVR
jgi:hypothetical protein